MENLKYTEILQLNKSLTGTISGEPYTVGILSNVTINNFKDIAEYFFRVNKIEPKIEPGNYDNIVQDSSSMAANKMVIIFYEMLNIADSVEGFFEAISDELFENLQQKLFTEIDIILGNLSSTATVVFNTFSSLFFVPNYSQETKVNALRNNLNSYLAGKKQSNLYIVDINTVIAEIGVSQAVDFRFYQSSKAPYTVAFFKQYCKALLPIVLINTGKLKKALIFDCDNTLWHGILGEDGNEGIDMQATSKKGAPFHMVQQMAKYLSKKGVIIGLCSKNNAEDVDDVLLNNPDIVLKNEDIVIKKVNWSDKVTNLKTIAKELNIGLDSLVFVDDSSFEVNLIQQQLPQVLTLQVPEKGYENFLQDKIYTYFNLNANKEDERKTLIYKEQFKRENEKQAHHTLEDYLASLDMQITIEINSVVHIPRVAQLTQKTNQFNLTTIRYTETEIQGFINNGFVITLGVKDKFGDSGLTGACLIKKDSTDNKTAIIDSLLMSCRVIGRNIEIAFLNYIIQFLRTQNFLTVPASYNKTLKNAQVEEFYEKAGFTLILQNEQHKEYQLDLSDYTDKSIGYIKINSRN